ncbi:6719_t:CDS:2 [Dentiscutata erythropus]|uniref:6719_t:CDS:1 n=1 Tax=Dentiscutata erythropus TaxID=1348616 RepID=A0A9N9D3F7_9GLOM|nr:6719_t:CDS:2 [Dentiscutata erythropus]
MGKQNFKEIKPKAIVIASGHWETTDEIRGFFSSIVISTLKKGTDCHGYVTDCKSNVMFDRGMKNCSGTCMVSERHNIPSEHSYCPHMSILGKDNKIRDKSVENVNKSGCFKVSGDSINFKLKEIDCPEKLPELCSDPK